MSALIKTKRKSRGKESRLYIRNIWCGFNQPIEWRKAVVPPWEQKKKKKFLLPPTFPLIVFCDSWWHLNFSRTKSTLKISIHINFIGTFWQNIILPTTWSVKCNFTEDYNISIVLFAWKLLFLGYLHLLILKCSRVMKN